MTTQTVTPSAHNQSSPIKRAIRILSVALCTYLCLSVIQPPPTHAIDTLQVTTTEPILEDRFWTTYDKSSGFAGQVRDLFEDRDGNMWFPTNTGSFQKYDGLRWTTYKVADSMLRSARGAEITQAQDGAMWFVTAEDVHRFDPSAQTEQDAWTHFDKAHFHEVGFDTTRTPHSATVWGAKDGAVWFGMHWHLPDSSVVGSIARYQHGRWQKIRGPANLPDPPVYSIYETRNGAIYFLLDKGILRFHKGIWAYITTAEGLGGSNVTTMLEATDGSLYFTHFREGISRYHNGNWTTYSDFEYPAIGL